MKINNLSVYSIGCIGIKEEINKIVVIGKDSDKFRFTRKLGVNGLNILGDNFTYYNSFGELHILDSDYIKEIKCYHDNKYIGNIEIEEEKKI